MCAHTEKGREVLLKMSSKRGMIFREILDDKKCNHNLIEPVIRPDSYDVSRQDYYSTSMEIKIL